MHILLHGAKESGKITAGFEVCFRRISVFMHFWLCVFFLTDIFILKMRFVFVILNSCFLIQYTICIFHREGGSEVCAPNIQTSLKCDFPPKKNPHLHELLLLGSFRKEKKWNESRLSSHVLLASIEFNRIKNMCKRVFKFCAFIWFSFPARKRH